MTEKKAALLIASCQYRDPTLQRLVAPPQDVKALERVLQDQNIGNFKVQTLLNDCCHDVRQKIEAFFAARKRDDLLLLYFSGHGIKDPTGQLYFAMTDTRCDLLRSTAVWSYFVNDIMRRSHSRRQVLVLDCCYSGAFARGMTAKHGRAVGIEDRFAGRGRVVLTSSDEMQYSFEGDQVDRQIRRSIFTQMLVRGLETGEADLNEDGHVTLQELYDYIHDHVCDETPQQTPQLWAFPREGQFIIAQNPHQTTTARPSDINEKSSISKIGPVENIPLALRRKIIDLKALREWLRSRLTHWRDVLHCLISNNKSLALTTSLWIFIVSMIVLIFLAISGSNEPPGLAANGICPTYTPTRGLATTLTASITESPAPTSPTAEISGKTPVIRIEPSQAEVTQTECRTAEPYRFGLGIYNDSDFTAERLLLDIRLSGDVAQVQEANYAIFEEFAKEARQGDVLTGDRFEIPLGEILGKDSLYVAFEILIKGTKQATVILQTSVASEEGKFPQKETDFFIFHCTSPAISSTPRLTFTATPTAISTPTPVPAQEREKERTPGPSTDTPPPPPTDTLPPPPTDTLPPPPTDTPPPPPTDTPPPPPTDTPPPPPTDTPLPTRPPRTRTP